MTRPCPTSLSYQGRFSLSCHAKPHEGGWWRARAWQWITLKQDNHINYSNLEWRKEGRMVFKSLMWLPFGFLNFILESGSYIANRSGKTRAKARKAKKQGLSKSSCLSIFWLLYSWFTDQWGPKSALQQQENWHKLKRIWPIPVHVRDHPACMLILNFWFPNTGLCRKKGLFC